MNRAALALLFVLLAADAAAQRIVTRAPGRSFYPPRPLDNTPIHPRATRTEGLIPLPPPDREWVRLDTPHFILFSSAGERRGRAIADDFEKLTALLLRTSPYFRLPPSRTRVFVFSDRKVVQPYMNATRGGEPVDAVGVTVRHAGGSTMLLDAGARGGDITTPRHELVHDLLRHNDRPLPLWIEEGLAEYYSTAGLSIQEHASKLRLRPRFTMEEMFAMKAGDPRSFDGYFYAQSWAAVSALMRLDQRAFFEMLRDLERGSDAASALRKRYGKSVADLAAAMRTAGALSAPVEQALLPAEEMQTRVSALQRPELLYQLAMLLSHVGGGDDEADRHYRAAIAAGPANAEAHIRYAEFLFSRERLDEARATAEHALTLAPDDARLYAIVGTASKDVGHLECAAAQLRGRTDLTFQLFAAYMQQGQRAKADALFATLAETPKVNDARRILLRADIARADALARDGQIAEAARVLRELATKMPGRTKEQLEQQAAALENLP